MIVLSSVTKRPAKTVPRHVLLHEAPSLNRPSNKARPRRCWSLSQFGQGPRLETERPLPGSSGLDGAPASPGCVITVQ